MLKCVLYTAPYMTVTMHVRYLVTGYYRILQIKINCQLCLLVTHGDRWYIFIYFIPSSEFNAYLKQIKVVLSTVKKISYFFTSDEYDLYIFSL